MAGIIYTLCAIVASICAGLLLRAYWSNDYRLLLWSALCFVGLALNHVLLVVDKLILPNIDLSLPRTALALVSFLILLYGLVWDAE